MIVSEDDHHNQLNGTERREEHPNPVTTIDDDVGKTGEMIGTKLGKGSVDTGVGRNQVASDNKRFGGRVG